MRPALLSGTAVLALLAASGCVVNVDSQGEIVRDERRFPVSGRPDLSLTTFDGAIDIRSWDKPEVSVEIEKRGPTKELVDALEVKATHEGNRIEVEVRRPRSESFRGIGFYRSASARLIVSVPRQADIRARSGDGSIRIEQVNGRIELRTGDGSIRGTDLGGVLVLNTGDGSITLNGAEGTLDLDTGDGGVNVSGRLSTVKLHTGDGSIIYRAEPDSRMTDSWNITTGDGTVTLYLPAGFDADVDAHTGDGHITNELGISAADGDDRRRTLRGRLGDGGKQLRIRTGDGSIRLRPS